MTRKRDCDFMTPEEVYRFVAPAKFDPLEPERKNQIAAHIETCDICRKDVKNIRIEIGLGLDDLL